MRGRFKNYGYAAILVLALAWMGRAYAQPAEDEARAKEKIAREEKFNTMIRSLDLTPQQQQEIASRRSREKQQTRELREKYDFVESELRRELDKENPDRDKVDALVNQMKDLTGRRYEQKVDEILSLKEILSPEQYRKLQERSEKFEKRRRVNHEKMGHHYDFDGRFSGRHQRAKLCQRLG